MMFLSKGFRFFLRPSKLHRGFCSASSSSSSEGPSSSNEAAVLEVQSRRRLRKPLIESRGGVTSSENYLSLVWNNLLAQKYGLDKDPSPPPPHSELLDSESSHSVIKDREILRMIQSVDESDERSVDECLKLLESISDRSKLGVGYLFFVSGEENSVVKEEFVLRTVKYLSKNLEKAKADDLVILSLMMYFRKNWGTEEALEIIDDVLLQEKMTEYLNEGKFTSSEICALTLGLKRCEIAAVRPSLRLAIYSRLNLMAEKIGMDTIDNMAVVNMIVLLSKNHLVRRDENEVVLSLGRSFYGRIYDIQLRTAVKLLTMSMDKELLQEKAVVEAVLNRLREENLNQLSIRDIVGLLKFLTSFFPHNQDDLYDKILREVVSVKDEDCTIQDVLDTLQSLLYLSLVGKTDPDTVSKVCAAINNVPDEFFLMDNTSNNVKKDSVASTAAGKNKALAEKCGHELFKALFPRSYEKNGGGFIQGDQKLLGVPSFLYVTTRLEFPEEQIPRITDFKINGLCRCNLKKMPMEFYVPSMSLETVTNRQRILIKCYRSMALAFGGETYLRILHVLPHFQNPDLIFGHIAGGNHITVISAIDCGPESDGKLRPAAKMGAWFVIHPVTRKKELPGGVEKIRLKHLEKLGYKILPITTDDIKKLDTRKRPQRLGEEILRRSWQLK